MLICFQVQDYIIPSFKLLIIDFAFLKKINIIIRFASELLLLLGKIDFYIIWVSWLEFASHLLLQDELLSLSSKQFLQEKIAGTWEHLKSNLQERSNAWSLVQNFCFHERYQKAIEFEQNTWCFCVWQSCNFSPSQVAALEDCSKPDFS